MKNSRLHIGLLLVSAAAFAGAIGLYAYMYHDTLAQTDLALQARASVSDAASRQQQSRDILSLASSTAASRAKLQGIFVPVDDAVTFIQSMESVGTTSGAAVAISSINSTTAEGDKPGTIGSITAHVTATGSWGSVMKAVELFEVLPYRVAISSLTVSTSLSPDDRSSAAHEWQASFDISAPTLI